MREKRKRAQSKKTGRRDDESAGLAQERQTTTLVESQESIARVRDQNPPPHLTGEAERPEHSHFSLAGPQAQALIHHAPSLNPTRSVHSPPPLEPPDLASQRSSNETTAFEQQGLKRSKSGSTPVFEKDALAVHPTISDKDASDSFVGPGAPAGMNLERRHSFSAEIAALRLEAAFFETKAFEFQNKLAKVDVELFSIRQELAHAQGVLTPRIRRSARKALMRN